MLEVDPPRRIERGDVVEEHQLLALDGLEEVDLVDLQQREVALAVLGLADLAGHHVAGAQVEAADLRRRDVDVVGPRREGEVGAAEEAEAVGQDLEDALGLDGRVGLLRLQDVEDQLLLAQRARGFDVELLRQLGEGQCIICRRGVAVGTELDRATNPSEAVILCPNTKHRRALRYYRGLLSNCSKNLAGIA